MSQVLKLPVVKKRGRKVTKGPMASIHVIYEWDEATPTPAPVVGELEAGVERMAHLIVQCNARIERERVAYEAFLDASPTVCRFPEANRYRSLMEVAEHKRAYLGQQVEVHWTDSLAAKIADRAKELQGEDEG